uniref:RGG repeats nuclear RNA binding protein A-like n=1 Tax=Osmia lignaria TaxID=473952 RepID=UPI0014793E58|nr:RGG repeats nuclear RNA binding protein A-like [Osmia lignaria]XP_034194586.1 RGG repeats nuclear RNA binding protein A-like [Osmia lignaria]XP_034194587.1 RGG repeats nuclear RNA binding protein A-like [Osmia lignaria]XP_034194588.1 RGG repeats nuclear RNA binding protein A-like [Osmia lignaria]XP_034194589.1 RGG repeats nuclear RNA binding protein A-like [Osmia lignaria]XP_034194590.1 RGG repeats nuclear RNA binding protein A-like [Osmia lignaria]XP_034194592.1 RGG repeats nuclear RNA bi
MDCTMAESQENSELSENPEPNHEQINQGRKESNEKPNEEINKQLIQLLATYKKQNAELKKEVKGLVKYSRGARGEGRGRGGGEGRGRGSRGRGGGKWGGYVKNNPTIIFK